MKKCKNIEKTKKRSTPREVIICDFDGTITEKDVCNEIMKKFGSLSWCDIGERYNRGLISHRTMNRNFVASLKVHPKELAIFLKQKIKVRNGFLKFLSFCQQQNILPIIVSGGWNFYIKNILRDVNLYFIPSIKHLSQAPVNTVPVICNELLFSGTRKSWQIKFSTLTGSPRCTPNKSAVANYLRKHGVKNIMAIGDGTNDYDLARAADFVFSRNGLTQYCKRNGIRYSEFSSFDDIVYRISETRNQTIRVLSLPSYHPYNKRFDNQVEIAFINPNCDFFLDKNFCSPKYLDNHFPPNTYDVVHFHFEYYLIPLETLKQTLKYFKDRGRLIVWTCHDRNSLLEKKTDKKREEMLFKNADAVTTLTSGCSRWLYEQFGQHRGGTEVIPNGYMAHPAIIENEAKRIKKDTDLFTIYVGDFRKSKDYIQSIRDFLSCPELASARLQIIFKPINIYPNNKRVEKQLKTFYTLIRHPRITTVCTSHISDTVLIRAFITSHAVILPYKWGTHSGQLELARDCGCHVVVSNVGFYKEQWSKIFEYSIPNKGNASYTKHYQGALIAAYKQKPLRPAGYWRKKEFEKIIKRHVKIYNKLIHDKNI